MSLILLDSTSAALLTQTVSDSVTLTDAQTHTIVKVLSDSITLTDSIHAGDAVNLSDSITLTDSQARTITKALSDSITLADSQTRVNSTIRTFSDSITFTDAQTHAQTKVLSDAVTLADGLSTQHSAVVTISDLIHILDAPPVVVNISPNVIGGNRHLSGPMTGGVPLAILGASVDMGQVEDTFAGGTINPLLWQAPAVAGSGEVFSISGAPRGVLQLSTGRTASSSAYLRGANLRTQVDAGIHVRVATLQLRSGAALATISLGAYVSSTTYFRAAVELTRASAQLHVTAVQGGSILQDVVIPVQSVKAFSLRILRNQQTCYVFMNDALVYTTTWTTAPSYIEMGVANGTAGASSITASVTKFIRNPVILFGSVPMTSVLMKSLDRVDILVPAQTRPGPQAVFVIADSLMGEVSFGLPNPYVYLPVFDYRRVGAVGQVVLTDISDTAVLSS